MSEWKSIDTVWKIIDEFPDYEVSERGNVRRIKTGRILKPFNDRGYHRYSFYSREKKTTVVRAAHRLVLIAFVGPPPEGMEACHNDGIKNSNHYSNLRWDTSRANNIDKIRHGTSTAKLSVAQVIQIRKLRAENRTMAEIGALFGVWASTVSRIVHRQKRQYVTGGAFFVGPLKLMHKPTNIVRTEGAVTHCLRGHPLSGDNIATHYGKRHCRECQRIRAGEFRERARQQREAVL